MVDDDRYLDQYERYESLVEPRQRVSSGGHGGQPRKAKPSKSLPDPVEADRDDAIPMTYRPARFEEGWLIASLRTFYYQQLVTDVTARVKGGKEASVYRCVGQPVTGFPLLAAKVYRPKKLRNLRNDAMYKEGRAVLTADGRPVKTTDHRTMRAIGKKTAFGEQVDHTSWLMYEFTTMERLHAAGASVPRPLAAGENAVLMEYVGDERQAAPTLSEVSLGAEEAGPLFREALRNIAIMLQHNVVHGDLSAYNLLYWEGRIVLIDFPQVASCTGNRSARFLLERDVARVCAYFQRQGVPSDPQGLVEDLWSRYGPPEPIDPAEP